MTGWGIYWLRYPILQSQVGCVVIFYLAVTYGDQVKGVFYLIVSWTLPSFILLKSEDKLCFCAGGSNFMGPACKAIHSLASSTE